MLKSHPHQMLDIHLLGTWENMETMFSRCRHNNTAIMDEEEDMLNALMIMALLHDFGKSTSYFQTYIRRVENEPNLKGGEKERHSLISAIVAYSFAKNFFSDNSAQRLSLLLSIYVSVKKHHGNLGDFLSIELSNIDLETLKLLKLQASKINYDKLNRTFKDIFKILSKSSKKRFSFSNNQIIQWTDHFNSELSKLRRKNRSTDVVYRKLYTMNDFKRYFSFLNMYSLLLESDKTQAGAGKLNGKKPVIKPDLVDNFKKLQSNMDENWGNKPLDKLREKAYREIDAKIPKCNRESLFTLTLPTGFGKTLSVLNFAIKLRKMRETERGCTPRIIYALPFLSIIDQNFDVIGRIFKSNGIKPNTDLLLKHHHLTKPSYFTQEENEYSMAASKLLIEGWHSEIIVTTFIQFFETLLSHRNSNLRRFNKLSNAIIIIDEIQALPVKYWKLIRYMLLFLSREMKTDIVLVTATQPYIFQPEDNVFSLCEFKNYFKNANRLQVKIDLHKQTVEEFASRLELKSDKTYLFIMNTIGSAQSLYKILKEKNNEDILFLSTQVIMEQRIERIKKIIQKECRIVVSTQLVEAGVDIDFDIVYRDLAPMDSLNQSAGRCNRNGLSCGEMFVVNLWNGQHPFSHMVYDLVLLDVTKNILKDKELVKEKDFLDLIHSYFNKIKDKTNTQESELVLEAVINMRFDGKDQNKTYISNFRLIEEQYQRVMVFVEINAEAKDLWLRFQNVQEIKIFFEREASFLGFKNEFFKYVISVPIDKTKGMPPEVNGIYYIDYDSLKNYYNMEYGYSVNSNSLIW